VKLKQVYKRCYYPSLQQFLASLKMKIDSLHLCYPLLSSFFEGPEHNSSAQNMVLVHAALKLIREAWGYRWFHQCFKWLTHQPSS